MNKSQIQISAHIEDAEYFNKLKNEYRAESKYSSDLFKDIMRVYRAFIDKEYQDDDIRNL